MLKDKDNQLSIYSILYNKVSENHTLKLINSAIDLSFVTKLLEKSYSKNHGRPAKDPELMIRLLILQHLYNLSDVRIIEEASLNLAYMWFLGINPDEDLPDPSLLAKFRVHRLQDVTLDEIIVEVVRQCVEKGIIKDTGISIDATHTVANTFKATPERVMKRLANKIFKTYKKECGDLPENINQNIPNYKEIVNHKEAKKVMKEYLESEIEKVENIINAEDQPKTFKLLENAREILSDPKFIEQRGVRSIVDQEARVGHKSKTDHFFGYKTEFIMTTEQRIITAVTVDHGAYVDGTDFERLVDLTERTGLKIEEVYGDKAYFRKPILDIINGIKAKPYIPVSQSVYRIDEEKFSYNKDSDEWFCSEGNNTVSRKHTKRKDGTERFKYYFEKEICRNCSKRSECISGKNIGRILEVGLNTSEFYSYSQEQKSEEFKEKYKSRACQEGKNGEMKNHHGLNRAKGYGKRSMSTQAKLTALAVNLKRIAGILSSKTPKFFNIIQFYIRIHRNFVIL
jgi:transposase